MGFCLGRGVRRHVTGGRDSYLPPLQRTPCDSQRQPQLGLLPRQSPFIKGRTKQKRSDTSGLAPQTSLVLRLSDSPGQTCPSGCWEFINRQSPAQQPPQGHLPPIRITWELRTGLCHFQPWNPFSTLQMTESSLSLASATAVRSRQSASSTEPPVPGFPTAEWNNEIFFFIIISNVFHKLDLKRENSPPYFRSDYQMMMDKRLIRVTRGGPSSCV